MASSHDRESVSSSHPLCYDMPMNKNTPAIPDDIAQAYKTLTPKQRAFVDAYRICGSKADAYRQSHDCSHWSANAVRVEAHRLSMLPNVALIIGAPLELAKARLMESVAENAQRLLNLASIADDVESESASRLAVAERAIRTSFEATGILQHGPAVQINVDNRKIDGLAMQLWNERQQQSNDTP